jgi:hypothetical protein
LSGARGATTHKENEMNRKSLPQWLFDSTVFWGWEDPPQEDPPPANTGDDPPAEGVEGDGGSDDEDDGQRAGGKEALKKDLADERKRRQRLENELAKRKKADEDAELATKDAVTQEKTKREQAEQRAKRLAEGFRSSEVRRAIRDMARTMNFHDPSDALVEDVLSAVDVEQDDEDPSSVTVDEASVKRAVKALADKKKHLVRPSGTEDGAPTGSSFGGTRSGKRVSKDEQYLDVYPSLR